MDKEKIEQAVRLFLEGIGEDPNREGLLGTPDRVARMCSEIYGGLGQDAGQYLHTTFEAKNNELILEKDTILWKSTYSIYTRWQSCRTFQAGKNNRSICKASTDSGAADSSDG